MNKGFTLIELLVVIAIIGMLSSIVLASLDIAKSKGSNTAIKGNLDSVRSQAELYYDSSPTGYLGVCSDTQIQKARDAANSISGGAITCNSNSTAWALSSPLKLSEGSNVYWCVDSTGSAKGHSVALGSSFVCP